ncbi:MAG: GNAT family N-acetyltransferase, partial [Alphaproteobacteria bacterium]|nr:GNAT family N-acetyltransferase [Alphaproteobacteria bacterium]
MLRIVPGDFDDPRVVDLLAFHHRTMHGQTP